MMKATEKQCSSRPIAPEEMRELRLRLLRQNRPIVLKPSPGFDVSVPFLMSTASSGSRRELRVRTALDDEAARQLAPIPTTCAIRMANALMIDRILRSGAFKNVSQFAQAIGVSKSMVGDLLTLLDQPPTEIERQLFEVK